MKMASAPVLLRSDAFELLHCHVTSFVGALEYMEGHHHSSIPFQALTTDGFSQETTRIRLSKAFNAQQHPSSSLRDSLKQLWDTKVAQHTQIFDADKFRLSHWFVEGGNDTNTLVLCMGMTSYRSFVSTCCSEYTSKLISDGLQSDLSTPFEIPVENLALYVKSGRYLSRKIGVSGILETLDGHLVLIRRSEASNVYPNLLDTPGGHPEPQRIGADDYMWKDNERERNDRAERNKEEDAVRELFHSVLDEIHEEINLQLHHLSPPKLLGIIHQGDALTPSFVFSVKCLQTSEQVLRFYEMGPQDAFESNQLVLIRPPSTAIDSSGAIPKQQLVTRALGCNLMDELTPCARAAVAFWMTRCK
uniref:Uncharacterized protein AlNc14C32G2934 n=1 Tax=Albugo laibachii Nc14 TaxID=890382 RepID=F0W7Y4_9STRA|nr:conserved hypothetical protein [Albugo laibachii Nc14]|eukprot:CCA17237.1 conserved hypothetical protein [Albugo laibachii Nc14]